jgi:hypothetical protein
MKKQSSVLMNELHQRTERRGDVAARHHPHQRSQDDDRAEDEKRGMRCRITCGESRAFDGSALRQPSQRRRPTAD